MTMDSPIVSAVVVVVISLLGYKWWCAFKSRLENKVPFEGIPTAPGGHWLTGHISLLRADFQQRMQVISSAHSYKEGLCGYWLFRTPCLAVNRCEDARMILHASATRKRNAYLFRHMRMFLGKRNIGVLRGREWKFHRSAILRAFGPIPVQQSREAILKVSSTFCESIQKRIAFSSEKSVEMDIEPLLKKITVDIFGQTALSTDLESCANLTPSPIAEAFDYLSSEMTRRVQSPFDLWSNFYFLPSVANRRHYKARTTLRTFIKDIISDRRNQESSCSEKDLLSNLLEAHEVIQKEEDYDLSDQTLSDIIMSLLFAGYDTTSIALSYALYCISQDTCVERNCVQEITRVWNTTNGKLDPEQLVYCRAVIMEALRLYPPAVGITRNISTPLKLSSGYVAPPDINVFVPIWFIQRDAKNFPRPTEFIPERWALQDDGGAAWEERCDETDENTTDSPEVIAAANTKAFFPFSAGARSCPGKNFALHEAVLVLASLLRQLKFQTLKGYQVEPIKAGLLQHPRGGIPMTISARNAETS